MRRARPGTASATMRRAWVSLPGSAAIRASRLIRWARSGRTRSGSLTCMGMSGSGVPTGFKVTSTRGRRSRTRCVRLRGPRSVCSAAGAGSTPRRAPGRRAGAGSSPGERYNGLGFRVARVQSEASPVPSPVPEVIVNPPAPPIEEKKPAPTALVPDAQPTPAPEEAPKTIAKKSTGPGARRKTTQRPRMPRRRSPTRSA